MKCSERLQLSRVKIFLFFLLFFSFERAISAEIILKAKAVVPTLKVKLSDIAQIEGTQTEKNIFSSVVISEYLPVCGRKTFSSSYIEHLIKNWLKEEGVFASFSVVGDKVEVKNECVVIKSEELKEKTERFLKENFKGIEIVNVSAPLSVKVPKGCKESLEVVSKSDKYFRVRWKFTDNGRVVKSFVVSVKVNPHYLVKRGNPVKVVYVKGPIKIEIIGIALENGREGDIIKVKNPSTGKILPCRVVGENVVLFWHSP